MKILLTGGSGKLGKQIVKLSPETYAPPHSEMDITDRNQVSEAIGKFQPEAIIHCAAYTNVAEAEKNRELCWKTNVEGTRNMIEYCPIQTHFSYLSTACVFDGKRGNYTENDVPQPENFYGLTKLLGEIIVQQSKLKWLIVRTNFVERAPWKYPKAFVDRWGTYLYADEVAESVLNLIDKKATGLIHVCGKEKVSMYELAKKTSPNVEPYTLEEYYRDNPNAAQLTQDMTLKSTL